MPLILWHNVLMGTAVVVQESKLNYLSIEAVEAGVPTAAIGQFIDRTGISLRDVHEIVIPARTLKHRNSRLEALSLDESDKLARLSRIFDQAAAVLGSTDLAREWLSGAKKRFAGRTPLSMVRTEVGARLVEEMLGQIDEGMFA